MAMSGSRALSLGSRSSPPMAVPWFEKDGSLFCLDQRAISACRRRVSGSLVSGSRVSGSLGFFFIPWIFCWLGPRFQGRSRIGRIRVAALLSCL